MKKHVFHGFGFLTVFFLLGLVACSSNSSKPSAASAKTPLAWPTEMRAIEAHMLYLLDVSSDLADYSKENSTEAKNITQSFKVLKTKAQNLTSKKIEPDKDPTLEIVAKRFAKNIELAADSFETGSYDFSRSVLTSSVAQCVQCHTRLEYGPQLSAPKLTHTLQNYKPIEKIQLLVATRNFTEAENEIRMALSDNNRDRLSAADWKSIVQLGLIMQVRFKNDMKGTQDFIKEIKSNSKLPFFVKKNLASWEKSIPVWRSALATNDKVKLADYFIKKGDHATKVAKGEAGLIYYLVAARILHESLAFTAQDRQVSEKLFRLGQLNAWNIDLGAWSMSEDYYEMCIRKTPHSGIAKKCYASLEQSLNQSFTGSLNQVLPDDIKNRLKEYKELSM